MSHREKKEQIKEIDFLCKNNCPLSFVMRFLQYFFSWKNTKYELVMQAGRWSQFSNY